MPAQSVARKTKERLMKKLIALLAMTAASGMALGQTGNAQPQTPAGQSSQTQAAPAAGQTAPAAGETAPAAGQTAPAAGQTAPAAGQAAPAPTGKHQPQAKTQEEFKAFNDVAAKPDPASMEQAANAFAQQYPNSELKAAMYQNLMLQYQNANNGDKTLEIGRKTLTADPDNVVALVTVASVLANRTRESDLDKEERINEAKKDASRAIQVIGTPEGIPAGYPPDKVDAYKNTILAMAYGSLGQAEFVNNNFPAAEESLRKATSYTGI